MNTSNSTPKITVAIPTFNRSWGLKPAVESVLSQSFLDFELLIVDDASTDDTPQVVASFDDPRIVYFRQTNNVGMVANWGYGLALARGKYFVFLADDDLLGREFLQLRFQYLESRSHAVAAFSRYESRDLEHRLLHTSLLHLNEVTEFQGSELLTLCFSGWFIGATMYRTDLIQKIWPRLVQDDLVLDIGLNTRLTMTKDIVALFLPVADMVMTSHPGQNSQAKTVKVFQQESRLLRELLQQSSEKAFSRVLRRELYDWNVCFAYYLFRNQRYREAIRQFLTSIPIQLTRRPAWLGLMKSLFRLFFPFRSPTN
jgi:glycosyltransferase involved in cell wall biosynthesis